MLGALAPELHVGQVEEPAIVIHRTTADDTARHLGTLAPDTEEPCLALGLGAGTPHLGRPALAAQIGRDRGV